MEILIEEVRIKNFRSHKNTKVKLTPLTLLVGANNAGKTSFLRALAVAINGDKRFVSREDLYISTDPSVEPAKEILIDVKISPEAGGKNFDESWSYEFGTDIKSDNLGKDFLAFRTVISFKATNFEPEIDRFVISDWDKEIVTPDKLTAKIFHLPMYFIDAKRDLLEDLTSPNSYFGRLVKQIKYNPADRQAIEKALEKINREAVSKSPVLEHLKNMLLELGQTVQSGGKGVEISPFPKRVRDVHKGLKVHFQDGASDSFSIEYHGMGTRSWASLLAFKAFVDWETQLKREEGEVFFPILALEEPEAHLHPNAQRQLYSQLKTIRGQKIISTHSPYIAGQCELDEILHFSKLQDVSEAHRLEIESLNPDQQRKIRREIFNTRGELIFAKAVVLFEGPTEEQSLPIFAKAYWQKDAFGLGICFVACGGSNYKEFIRLLSVLGIKWFLLSDYERVEVVNSVNGQAKEFGIDDPKTDSRFVLLGNAYENYLIEEGYQNALKEAIIEFEKVTEFDSEEEKVASEKSFERRRQELDEMDDTALKLELKRKKTRLSAIYSRIITEDTNEEKRIPQKIKQLFDRINDCI